MRNVILILAALAAVVLVGGIAFVVLFMEENPDTALVDGNVDDLPNNEVRVLVDVATTADLLEALDYETTQNRDTVAWLVVPNTRINNSVLQSHDNLFYLRLNERREDSIYGCYFADAECNVSTRELLNHNTIVYGHSDLQDNPEGPRFSQLFKFTDPEFARSTPTIELSTIQSEMHWQVFAVFYTTVAFDYIEAEPEGGLKALADEAKRQSIYDYGVAVGDEDHILTLSTCSVKDGNDGTHRMVVMAKLLPENAELPEKAEVTSKNPGEAPRPPVVEAVVQEQEPAEGEVPAEGEGEAEEQPVEPDPEAIPPDQQE